MLPTWTMLLTGEITNTLSVGLEAERFAKQISKKFSHCCLSVFWPSTKSSNERKPENNSLIPRTEKHQRGNDKPQRNGQRWQKLTQIANDDFKNFRLNFSKCANSDLAPLILSKPPRPKRKTITA